jgi:transposase
MQAVTDQPQAPTAIHTDLGAIFVSLELSRSTWLITSISPGGREKMSKHSVSSGDISGLLDRFRFLQEKARSRTAQQFPIIVVQEAGLDGFWIHRSLVAAGIEKRGEPRVCAMVLVPTPEEEDRRRLARERKALTNERVRHVNRIKGLLFGQGVSRYEPLRRDRRQRLEELRTGDGRALPRYLKAQIGRELDRLELLLDQIKVVEGERDEVLASAQAATSAPAMLLGLKGIGQEFATILWMECLYRHFDNRRQVAAYAGLARHPGKAGRSIESKVFRKRAIRDCARH